MVLYCYADIQKYCPHPCGGEVACGGTVDLGVWGFDKQQNSSGTKEGLQSVASFCGDCGARLRGASVQFESSVRLYQRRPSSRLRYHDPELAEAEASHCQSRIRSCVLLLALWLGRDGPIREWGPRRRGRGLSLRVLRGEAEVRSMCALEGRSTARRALIEEHAECCCCTCFALTAMVLSTKRVFFLTAASAMSEGHQVERMVAFHHTADCALVLTGSGAKSSDCGAHV